MSKESLEDMKKRLGIAAEHWKCLIQNKEDLAIANRNLDWTTMEDIMRNRCNIGDEDILYYMTVVMNCRNRKSW